MSTTKTLRPVTVPVPAKFAPREPVEVRIEWADSYRNGNWHLVAYVTDHGTIATTLTRRGTGINHATSTLQSRLSMPGKAVPGWQHEVIAFANNGLGKVVEVR